MLETVVSSEGLRKTKQSCGTPKKIIALECLHHVSWWWWWIHVSMYENYSKDDIDFERWWCILIKTLSFSTNHEIHIIPKLIVVTILMIVDTLRFWAGEEENTNVFRNNLGTYTFSLLRDYISRYHLHIITMEFRCMRSVAGSKMYLFWERESNDVARSE